MEIVIGISGASGVQYGIRLLEVLSKEHETHLVISEQAEQLIAIETSHRVQDVKALASHVYDNDDFTAGIASGSSTFDCMLIAPCSMKTLASIATGVSDTLIGRAADICLKEDRKLILVTRETPLSLVHLENMVKARQAGALVMPACPAFYPRPQSVDDMVDFIAGRALDLIGVRHALYKRWK
ncbi:MAG TPA: UbiX family flavin prenyltransferase [Candidatus Methanoperedenaceae archaeon]|nr:UbiX family flavin prenyltransferase [Candidatus Methanoperedenaceae archaeon]